MFQKIIVAGNLGRDPEEREIKNGTMVSFSVAVNEYQKTTWFNVKCFGKTAEIAGRYLKKGSGVIIAGSLDINDWEDKDGNKRTSVSIIARELSFMGKADEKSEKSKKKIDKDDIPF